MGRTNPTFRDALRRFEDEWQPYRRALRQQHRGDFDALVESADRFADAAGYRNSTDPVRAILLSMLLAHQVELRELRTRLAALESGVDGVQD